MIWIARITATAALLIQLAAVPLPVLRYPNRDFAGSDFGLAEAAVASSGGLLLIGEVPGYPVIGHTTERTGDAYIKA